MTDAELRDFLLKHLHYELWMLLETARRLLLDDQGVHRDLVVKNAVVESFCIHARALAAFLYPERFNPRTRDVSATDYVTDTGKWQLARGETPEILVVVRERTGKEIAHLTTQRKEYGDPDEKWPTVEIVDALLAASKLFVQHAVPERLASSEVDYIKGLQRPMAKPEVEIYSVGSTEIIRMPGLRGPSSPSV